MFSGIVEEKGIVRKVEKKRNLHVLHVAAKKIDGGTKKGDSISVNGVCLTVTKKNKGLLTFDLIKETLLKTTLKGIMSQRYVNLERSLKYNNRINGHFVTGHVDAVGKITKIVALPNYLEFRITKPRRLSRYLVPKGSICIDGVSLTIGDVKKNYFSVYLIPFTLKETTLGSKKIGDQVNIETDIIAKYIFQKKLSK